MRARVHFGAFLLAGLAIACALALLVSPQASSQPDGLERVATDQGFSDAANPHALDGLPTAGYAVEGVDDDRLGTGLAGVIGVAVTFALTGGAARAGAPALGAHRGLPGLVGGGHRGTDGLLHVGSSSVHRLAPHLKVAATVAFVLAVVATPREAVWALALHALVVASVAALARLPLRLVLRRMRIEVPFLAFAVFLPVVGTGPRVEVLGWSLSEPGLWAAWNIVAKATLGVAAAIVLAATTPVPALLAGLDRLRVPRTLTAIAGFMVRYLDVIAGEAARMRIARLSRGHDPRWLWQARAIGSTAGTLFVRSYERGERVHLAMLARGYDGTMPVVEEAHGGRPGWPVALVAPLAAVLVALAARLSG